MKEDAAKVLLGFVLTFLGQLVLSFSVQYLSRDKGELVIGNRIEVGGNSFISVDATNFETSALDDIKLTIPATTQLSQINLSNPVQLQTLSNVAVANGKQLVSISSLAPRTTTRLLIPTSRTDEQPVAVINASDRRIAVRHDNETEPPFYRAFRGALFTAVMMMIVYVPLTWWLRVHFDQRFTAISKTSEEQDKSLADAIKKLKESDNRASRIRILLLARLSDTHRELHFWQDTVRMVLKNGGREGKGADKLFDAVTEGLKTYSTRFGGDDFKTIQVLAGLLASPKSE